MRIKSPEEEMGKKKKQRPSNTDLNSKHFADAEKKETSDAAVENGVDFDDVNGVSPSQQIDDAVFKKCSHLKTALNISTMRKKLKTMNSVCCEQCESSNCVGEEDVVWLCLYCCHRGCGRDSANQHALKHFDTNRSVQHSLVFNLSCTQPLVWCYQCDCDIPTEVSTPTLKQILAEVQARLSVLKAKSHNAQAKRKNSAPEHSNTNSKTKNSKEKTENIPSSVKGLSNLGNTCFFNSVVQNLIQTHHLDEILDSGRLVKGANVTLRPSASGDNFIINDAIVQEDQKVAYAPLNVTLNDDLGPLTQSLCAIFKEFKSAKASVLTPSNLFGQVCKKAPRFKGFQQQDSHELLRYLLDALREEEQRRLRVALLQSLNLPKAVKPDSIPVTEKNRLKAYDRAADVTCVEQVFGGKLVQCIKCLECGEASLKFESFLDLSLPIAENKNSNSNSVVAKLGDDFLSSLESTNSGGKSKYMQKKEKKLNRKQSKNISGAAHRRKGSLKQETDEGDAQATGSANEECKNDVALLNDSITENLQKLSLDDEPKAVTAISDGKIENDIEYVDSPNQDDCSSTPSPPPTSLPNLQSDNLHKYMEPLSASSGQLLDGGGCCLANCLTEFMSTEILNGKNKFGCEHCSKVQNPNESPTETDSVNNNAAAKSKVKKVIYTDALKQYLIYSPPAVLTVHLKRFHQIGGSFRKINKHVDFPVILDLAPFCSKNGSRISPNENRILYALYGVVSHSGRLTGGHYVAYVKVREKSKHFSNVFLQSGPTASANVVDLNKNIVTVGSSLPQAKIEEASNVVSATDGKWFYISDGHVTETLESKVLTAEAYLLFYERIL